MLDGVVVLIFILKFGEFIVSSGEESPEDADECEEEDNAGRDGDRDQDDDTSREEV